MALVCAAFPQAVIAPLTAANVGMTCHVATTFRLYEAEFGRLPTFDQVLPIQPATFMTRLLPHGKRLRKPLFQNVRLTANSVILFEYGGNAVHSCIAADANTLGGYNQTTFFRTPGVAHGYSAHDCGDLEWDTLGRNVASRVAHAIVGFPATYENYGQLVEVPEQVARAALRSAAQ